MNDKGSCASNGGPGEPAWARNTDYQLLRETQVDTWTVQGVG